MQIEYQSYLNFQKSQENTWQILESSQTPKLYSKNQMIYWQGEFAEFFYYLKKGRVKIFLSSENGMEKTLTVLEKETIFGEAAFFDGLPRVSSAKALTKCEIIPINRKTLLNSFSKEPALALDLLQYLARTVRMLSAQVDNMTFLQADKRIAQFLVNFEAKPEEENVIYCTHEEIGNLVGTSRVTVSKILNRFVKAGWISTQYHRIVIENLEAISEFSRS